MDFEHYVSQVRGLRRYAGVPEIPSDPYDIPVSLAKRLLGFDRSISFTPVLRREYLATVKLSREHGPCCCHCWRWTMFKGQAKFLLTTAHFSPREVAGVWNLEDGCGGPAESNSSS